MPLIFLLSDKTRDSLILLRSKLAIVPNTAVHYLSSNRLFQPVSGEYYNSLVERSGNPNAPLIDRLPRRNCFYVLQEFEGIIFERIQERKLRTLGCRVVLDHLRARLPLPHFTRPLWSTILRGYVVTISCPSIAKKSLLRTKLEMLSGTYTANLSKSQKIDALITTNLGSDKYHFCGHYQIPILRCTWLDEAWAYGQVTSSDLLRESQLSVDMFGEEVLHRHLVGVFEHCVISLSGFNGPDRKFIEGLVDTNKGTFTPAMDVTKCSHLILKDTSGRKYEHAIKWKIHTVSLAWLTDSVEHGYALPEKNYLVIRSPSAAVSPTSIKEKKDDVPVMTNADTSVCQSVVALQEDIFQGYTICLIGYQGSAPKEGRKMKEWIEERGGICLHTKEQIIQAEEEDEADDSSAKATATSKSLPSVPRHSCRIYVIATHLKDDIALKIFENLQQTENYRRRRRRLQDTENGGESQKIAFVRSSWLIQCITDERFVDTDGEWLIKQSDSCEAKPSDDSNKAECRETTEEGNDDPFDGLDEEALDLLERGIGSADAKNDVVPTERLKFFALSQFLCEEEMNRARDILVSNMILREIRMNDITRSDFHESCIVVMPYIIPQAWQLTPNTGITSINTKFICVTPVFLSVHRRWHQFPLESLINSEEFIYRPQAVSWLTTVPPPKKLASLPLKNCIVTCSGREGIMRSAFRHFAQLCGAEVQESLSKSYNPHQRLRANTHLVCHRPTGAKYIAAKQWNIPVVSEQWLLVSALTGKCPDPLDYRVANDGDSVDELVGKKVFSDSSSSDSSAVNKCALEAVCVLNRASLLRRTVTDTDIEYDNNPNKCVKEPDGIATITSVTDLASQVVTDACPVKMPPTETTTQTDNIDVLSVKRRSQSGGSFSPSEDVLCGVSKRPFEGMLVYADNCVGTDIVQLKKKVQQLGGVLRILFDSQSSRPCDVFVCHHYDADYLVRNEELRTAIGRGIPVVLPCWVHQCREAFQMLPVDDYRAHKLQKPDLKRDQPLGKDEEIVHERERIELEAMDRSGHQLRQRSLSSSEVLQRRRSEEEAANNEDKSNSTVVADDDYQEKENFNNNVDSFSAYAPDSNSGSTKKSNRSSMVRACTVGAPSSGEPVLFGKGTVHEISEASEPFQVTWEYRDMALPENNAFKFSPRKRRHSEKDTINDGDRTVMERRALENSDSLNRNNEQPDDDGDCPSTDSRKALLPMAHNDVKHSEAVSPQVIHKYASVPYVNHTTNITSTPSTIATTSSSACTIDTPLSLPYATSHRGVFVISGLIDAEKIRLASIVVRLGGEMDTSSGSVAVARMRTTHLVCQSPSRNEKFMSCCAAGCWILHKSYLEASDESNRFLDERPYEWGGNCGDNQQDDDHITNTTLSELTAKLPVNVRQLTCAATQWRRIGGGAFAGWKVVFAQKMRKATAFHRLIAAGQGKVIDTTEDYPDPSDVTHAFIDLRSYPSVSELRALLDIEMRMGFPWYRFDYLSYYLTRHTAQHISTFEVNPTIVNRFITSMQAANSKENNATAQRKRPSTSDGGSTSKRDRRA